MRSLAGLVTLLLAMGCGAVSASSDAAIGSDAADPAADAAAIDASSIDGAPQIGCATQFVPWFQAGFELPSGGSIGTADFPSSPWRPIDGLVTAQTGRARANATATTVASQGVTFAGTALRVRYQFIAVAADHKVSTFVNASATGTDGLEISLSAATGELSVTEKTTPLGATSLGALTVGTVYFVEAVVLGANLKATLATGNYGSVPGATLVGELTVTTVASTTVGSFTGLRFTNGGSVDDLTIALCGRPAPSYTRRFFDDFERANSATLGSAVMPNVPWIGDTDATSISQGRLDFSGGGVVRANAGTNFPNQGLRVRASGRLDLGGWNQVAVNGTSTAAGVGFDLWHQDATKTFIEYGGGSGSSFYPVPLDATTTYFMQLDIDGSFGVVTFRSGGFDGPILFAQPGTGLTDTTDTFVSLGEVVGGKVSFDELSVDLYAP